MKTSHRINVLPLSVFTAIALTLSIPSFAADLSEKTAFCLDKWNISRSNYENQKIYNKCMEHADELIEEYEKSKIELNRILKENRIEQEKQWKKETAERAERKARQEAANKLKNEQEIKKYDDLFSEFD